MGFRMTDSPFLHTPQRLDTDVDGFHFIRLYDPSRASSCTVSDSKVEAETVAFGYPARALVFEQRVELGTFGYPRHAPSLTAGDGLVLLKSRPELSFPDF